MTGNTIYLVNSEIAVPMFKQTVQTLGATIPTSVLAYAVTSSDPGYSTSLTETIIDEYFLRTRSNLEVYTLTPGDAVIFALPMFAISQEIATGMSIYVANIGAAVGGYVKVIFHTNLVNE